MKLTISLNQTARVLPSDRVSTCWRDWISLDSHDFLSPWATVGASFYQAPLSQCWNLTKTILQDENSTMIGCFTLIGSLITHVMCSAVMKLWNRRRRRRRFRVCRLTKVVESCVDWQWMQWSRRPRGVGNIVALWHRYAWKLYWPCLLYASNASANFQNA